MEANTISSKALLKALELQREAETVKNGWCEELWAEFTLNLHTWLLAPTEAATLALKKFMSREDIEPYAQEYLECLTELLKTAKEKL